MKNLNTEVQSAGGIDMDNLPESVDGWVPCSRSAAEPGGRYTSLLHRILESDPNCEAWVKICANDKDAENESAGLRAAIKREKADVYVKKSGTRIYIVRGSE